MLPQCFGRCFNIGYVQSRINNIKGAVAFSADRIKHEDFEIAGSLK